jgi:hypothetical protein
MVFLLTTLIFLGIPSYDERNNTETTDELIMRLCGSLGVRTIGGETTLEDSE